MPPKPPRRSRRRTITVGKPGAFVNRPSLKGAPRAKSPRKFETVEEAVKAAKRTSRKLGVRSRSSSKGSFTPGGGKERPKTKARARKMKP